jgi:hypothetical protein
LAVPEILLPLSPIEKSIDKKFAKVGQGSVFLEVEKDLAK